MSSASSVRLQLDQVGDRGDPDRVNRMRNALIEPLRNVYGISDKVVTMALSCILLAAPKDRVRWIEVGGCLRQLGQPSAGGE